MTNPDTASKWRRQLRTATIVWAGGTWLVLPVYLVVRSTNLSQFAENLLFFALFWMGGVLAVLGGLGLIVAIFVRDRGVLGLALVNALSCAVVYLLVGVLLLPRPMG